MLASSGASLRWCGDTSTEVLYGCGAELNCDGDLRASSTGAENFSKEIRMAAARQSTTKRRSTRENGNVRAAISGGRAMAEDVIAFRKTHARRRVTAERRMARAATQRRAPEEPSGIPAKTRAFLGPPAGSGVLMAEGDSWFDYPFHDVLQMLEDDYLYDVESVAHKGDCVEDMAHAGGQFEEFARRLEKLLRADKVPRAILLSGGGNDIAGDEFPILLNHAASGLPTLNADIVRGVIDVRLRSAYARIISGLTTISKAYLNRPIPIVTHGYAYAVPDGRGFLGGFWLLPGPWLRPGFQKKGYADLRVNRAVVADLIDRFNEMLEEVSASPQFAHVHYLNLRKTLKNDAAYKQHWANELHPSRAGFQRVTKEFAGLISTF
jgi:lysophospholipase L1-like esterase